MFLAKQSSAVAWHNSKAIADVFEYVVWVDLAAESDSVDLGSWVGVGSKLNPFFLLHLHHNVGVFSVRSIPLAFEGCLDAGKNIVFLYVCFLDGSLEALLVYSFTWTQVVDSLDVSEELLHVLTLATLGSKVPDAVLTQIFHHNVVSIVLVGVLVVQ